MREGDERGEREDLSEITALVVTLGSDGATTRAPNSTYPRSVNFTAFETRLYSTCRMRPSSLTTYAETEASSARRSSTGGRAVAAPRAHAVCWRANSPAAFCHTLSRRLDTEKGAQTTRSWLASMRVRSEVKCKTKHKTKHMTNAQVSDPLPSRQTTTVSTSAISSIAEGCVCGRPTCETNFSSRKTILAQNFDGGEWFVPLLKTA